MKKITRLLSILSILPVLTGCGQKGGKSEDLAPKEPIEDTTQLVNEEITIVDGQGREVTINKTKVNRVVCVGAGALRFYSYICGKANLVAVEEIENKPFGVGTALRPYHLVRKSTYEELPLCGKGGPQAQTPDLEAIISNNPNIIVSFFSKDVNDELSKTLKIPVIGLTQGKEGIFDSATLNSLKVLGEVFHRTNRYNELESYINSTKEEFNKLTTDSEETYYAGCIGNWGKTNLYGSFRSFPVFNYAHVNNAVDQLSDLSPVGQVTIDAEKLTEINPDKIFIDGAGFEGFLTDYKTNPSKYEGLDAFKNNEIYSLLPYNAYYTNLEIQLISTYYVASVAHQQSFANFDIKAKADEITDKFLGKGVYDEMITYSTALGGYHKLDIKELAK